MDKIIDGKQLAEDLNKETLLLSEACLKRPGLTVVLIGNNTSSLSYIRQKKKACIMLGFNFHLIRIAEDATMQEVIDVIHALNTDEAVDGIIVQLPFPKAFYDKNNGFLSLERSIIDAIDTDKDIDGLTSGNIAKYFLGDTTGFLPATPQGVLHILKSRQYQLQGKNVIIMGRSLIVGKPLAMLLMNRDATVTVLHSKTENPVFYMRQADVLIAAIGSPGFVRAGMIKQDAFLIDVGISFILGKGLRGDIDQQSVIDKCSNITPVPGGVGPLTVAFIMRNVLQACIRHDRQKTSQEK